MNVSMRLCIMWVDKAAGCQAAAGQLPAYRGIFCGSHHTGSALIVTGRFAVVKIRDCQKETSDGAGNTLCEKVLEKVS